MTQYLIDALNVTGPIFVIILVGLVLRRIGMLTEPFLQVASKLVFNICLPVLLFTTIVQLDISDTFNPDSFLLTLFATLVTFGLSWLAALTTNPRSDRGVVTQACFRSNLGVIGLALAANAYGPEGLAIASLLMASLTVAFNVLSVVVLSTYQDGSEPDLRKIVLDVLRNPLIIAIAIATLVAALGVPVPGILVSAGDYIGSMALPLALLGTGAAISLRALRQSGWVTLLVVLMKSMLLPAVVVGICLVGGLRGAELGVIFLLFVAPAASAGYAMVKAMGGNDVLAANLVTATTFACLITGSFGLFLLRGLGFA